MIKGRLSTEIKLFLLEANKPGTSPKDLEKSIQNFSDRLESAIYDAIKSAIITIPPGMVVVVGSPTTQTNVVPIVLKNSLS